MVVDPSHRYSSEAERANKDIYDNCKLKKPFGLHDLYKINSVLLGCSHEFDCINPSSVNLEQPITA